MEMLADLKLRVQAGNAQRALKLFSTIMLRGSEISQPQSFDLYFIK